MFPLLLMPLTTDSVCVFDCYQFRSSSSNVLTITSRDCDTCSTYGVTPGRYSHLLAGGVPFYIPAGCEAKTSTFGQYWAGNGWHWFPHHTGTVTMRPSAGSWRTDC